MGMTYVQPIFDGSAFEAREYVISMLKKIGDLESFEIHFDEMYHNPITVNGETYYYTCVLINDNGDEFYLNTNCGYGGTGPKCTEDILQLLGFREECEIFKEKFITRQNINLIHDLNVLFISNKCTPQEKQRFKLEIKPYNAYVRYKTLEILSCMGDVMNYTCATIDDKILLNYPTKYYSSGVNQEDINKVIFLDRSYDSFSNEQIISILECLLQRMWGEDVEYRIVQE